MKGLFSWALLASVQTFATGNICKHWGESHLQPCRFECEYGTVFDYSELLRSAPRGYLTVNGAIHGTVFYFGVCGTVPPVSCQGSQAANPIGIQVWGGSPPSFPADSCAALGKYDTAACSLESGPYGAGIVCRYTGGDGVRKIDIHYRCDRTQTVPSFSIAQSPDDGRYELNIQGLSMCALETAEPPPPLPPPPPPLASSCASWCNRFTCEMEDCGRCPDSVCPMPPFPAPSPGA